MGKKIWILPILLLFVVVTALILYQSQQNPVNVDFEIVSAGWDGPLPRVENNGSVAIIYGVAVTFKAVGGDAHDVVIQSWTAGSDLQPIGTMSEDAPRTVLLSSPLGYLTRKEESGYPVKIRITSRETGTKVIKFYIIL